MVYIEVLRKHLHLLCQFQLERKKFGALMKILLLIIQLFDITVHIENLRKYMHLLCKY